MNNFVIDGSNKKPISFDIQLPTGISTSPLIIFLHGFKGFKDWGHWPLLASELVNKNYAVLRMNFSHNGTTQENPIDFVDLEAFGNNTFSKEVQDVQDVINWLHSENNSFANKADLNQLSIVAHSRGGAIAMITANEDERIDKIITLSGVGNLARYTDEELAHWKNEGVIHLMNGRTNQNMPLYYTLAQDYIDNISRFELSKIISEIKQPYLVIHAEKDETVKLSEAEELAKKGMNTTLEIINEADHSFGGKHPFVGSILPIYSQEVVRLVDRFLTK